MQLEFIEIKHDAQTNFGKGRTTTKRAKKDSKPSQPCEGAGEAMAEKDCGIYAFRCLADGRFYVGSSVKIKRRYRAHTNSSARGSEIFFHKRLRQLGRDAFVFGVIEYCESAQRFEREKHWIRELSAATNGFNNVSDPTAFPVPNCSKSTRERMRMRQLGKKRSRESVEKTRAANRGRKNKPEAIERMRISKIGKKHTEETKLKMRLAKLGRKQSKEHIEKVRLSKLGTKPSRECLEKARLACLGRSLSNESRQKISKALTGKKQSPETRLKRSLAMRGRKLTAEHIEKSRRTRTGMKQTPQAIENMRKGWVLRKRAALIKGVIAAPVSESEKVVDVPAEQT